MRGRGQQIQDVCAHESVLILKEDLKIENFQGKPTPKVTENLSQNCANNWGIEKSHVIPRSLCFRGVNLLSFEIWLE